MSTQPSSQNGRVEQASDWLCELDRGNMSVRRREEFQEWLADAVNRRAFDELICLWNDYETLAALLRQDFPGIPQDLRSCVAKGSGQSRSRIGVVGGGLKGLALAACVTMAVLAGVLYFSMSQRSDMPTLRTGKGDYLEAQLDDGSTVRLNTETTLDIAFSRSERRVVLGSGEAFFSVAKEAQRPFVVEAQGGLIRAIGTAFSVRNSIKMVKVAVLEGVVEVIPSTLINRSGEERMAAADNYKIKSGQSLTYGLTLGTVENLSDREIVQVTAWQGGRVYFQDTPLAHIVAELNRYSHAKIVLSSTELGEVEGSGVFFINDIEGFLRGLETALPLEVTRINSDVIIIGDASDKANRGNPVRQ